VRTAGQHAASRRRGEARQRAVRDRDWFTVGWVDRRLNRAESACPFVAGSPQHAAWLAGFRAIAREGSAGA